MAADWSIDKRLSLVKDQLGVVTSDLHNVMARLRFVVGNLGVLSWQIDALVKASATLGCRAHMSTLASVDVTQLQRTPAEKSNATKLLGRRRSIVVSLGETVSARRDTRHDKDRHATPNGILHARDVGLCQQRRSIGKKSLKHNGQQQNACDRSDAPISFFRRQAETVRRTFHLRCRRRRRSPDVDTAVNETESKNAAHNRCVLERERRSDNTIWRRDCDKLSMTAGKTLTYSMALQRLHETIHRNDMLVCSGTNLVALPNVPKSKNISQTGDEVHRTYRRVVAGVPVAVKPLSREHFNHRNGFSPWSSRLSFSSQLSLISGSTMSPAVSYNDVYEQALDETLDLVSDDQPVSPYPDTVESYTVHPAYHGITTMFGKSEISCYRRGKSMCVATLNGVRLPATKCRPSSTGGDYFWRSIIEP